MKKIKEIFLYANWRNIFFSLLGSAILAFGTHYIYANSEIPEAGMIGVCLIIEKLTGISVSISNIVLTFFCYILAWRLMGTKYILNTSVATIGFSVFYALFSTDALKDIVPSMAEYPLLAALVGAIFVEVGTALIHRFGSASSGEQALTMAIVKRGGFEFGWIQFIRDFIVLSLSIVTYDDPSEGIYPVIYAILIMTLLTPVTDYIINAPKKANFTKRVQRTRKSWSPIIALGLVLATLLTAAGMYLTDFYPAEEDNIKKYIQLHCDGEYTEQFYDEVDMLVYMPKDKIKAGFVFYPGGKVDPKAYAPLLAECAKNGILCVAIEMPFNLAVFGINKGLDVLEAFPDVENWYIGGHSLGGSMAASCAANHPDKFDGIILLASYSTSDISNFKVLSVFGSNDQVMEKSNYDKYKKENFPSKSSGKFTEIELVGGNHAGFGMYGEQRGDGTTTSNVKQIEDTVAAILNFIITE